MLIELTKPPEMSQEKYDQLCSHGGEHYPILLGMDAESGVVMVIGVIRDKMPPTGVPLSSFQRLIVEKMARSFVAELDASMPRRTTSDDTPGDIVSQILRRLQQQQPPQEPWQ